MQPHFDIKICGLTTEETVEAAIAAGASMVGFVFAGVSPRYIAPEKAAGLISLVRGRAKTVGLFADQSEDDIKAILAAVPLDLIQIHGRETREERASLANAFPECLMARGIWDEGDLPGADDLRPGMWLFDAQPPEGYQRQGGHGVPFAWSVLSAYRGETPFMLAGGLTPSNIAEAIKACANVPGFAGVDVSSGVEARRGIKDPKRIAAFVEAALAARAELSSS